MENNKIANSEKLRELLTRRIKKGVDEGVLFSSLSVLSSLIDLHNERITETILTKNLNELTVYSSPEPSTHHLNTIKWYFALLFTSDVDFSSENKEYNQFLHDATLSVFLSSQKTSNWQFRIPSSSPPPSPSPPPSLSGLSSLFLSLPFPFLLPSLFFRAFIY